jgi:hypothetical protein
VGALAEDAAIVVSKMITIIKRKELLTMVSKRGNLTDHNINRGSLRSIMRAGSNANKKGASILKAKTSLRSSMRSASKGSRNKTARRETRRRAMALSWDQRPESVALLALTMDPKIKQQPTRVLKSRKTYFHSSKSDQTTYIILFCPLICCANCDRRFLINPF